MRTHAREQEGTARPTTRTVAARWVFATGLLTVEALVFQALLGVGIWIGPEPPAGAFAFVAGLALILLLGALSFISVAAHVVIGSERFPLGCAVALKSWAFVAAVVAASYWALRLVPRGWFWVYLLAVQVLGLLLFASAEAWWNAKRARP